MGRLGHEQLGGDQLGSPGTIREIEQWRVRVEDTIETGLYDVQVVDTANPFGNYAIAKIDDVDGDAFDTYTRGTRVNFLAKSDSGDAFTSRFVGYVVEARELDQQGADALEVEVYSFDQFLRQDTVTNDQSGKTLTNALKDIIETDTPVTWDASNVTVADPQDITQSYRGENVENALLSLRQKSGGEDFGVNDSLEFFWQPRESSSAPRNIDNSQWFNFDLPEEGKRTINEVTVFFDNGSKNVTVDNGADKTELQNNLNTTDPVVLSEEVARPDITDIDDARSVAEAILDGKESILTGTVTTFGLIDARPGDITDITIVPRGIDGEFRIAELEYRWGSGQTIITVVEKRGDQDDLLVNLSDTLKRVELQNVDRDAVRNTVTSTNLRALISVEGDVSGTNYISEAFTNVARNKMRTGWAGDGNIDVADIAVGNGPDTATRSDTDLVNELERTSASESFPDSTTARYVGSVNANDIREVGLFDSGGDLLVRATVPDTTFPSPATISIDLTISNDSDYGSGVVTNDGQTAIRDVIADNSPNLPTNYAYGDGTADPAESDTSLGNQLVSVALDEILVQNATTQAEWESILSIASTDPVSINSGTLELHQTCFTQEGEDGNNVSTVVNLANASEGVAASLFDTSHAYQYSFTLEHGMPADNFEIAYRWDTEGGDPPEISWTLDGPTANSEVLRTTTAGTTGLGWKENLLGEFDDHPQNDLEAGDYTITADVTASGTDAWFLDVIAPHDTGARFSNGPFSYTFDDSTDGNDHLSGPELYPDEYLHEFDEANTRRTLDDASVEQTWNDTSNNQKIELSNDGGSTWITTNNSQTASAMFASPETGVRTRVGMSRFGSQSATPTSGVSGQTVSSHDLFANIDAITPADIGVVDVQAIAQPNTINGQTIREAAELDTNGTALTRSTFADIDVGADERVISSESLEWAND